MSDVVIRILAVLTDIQRERELGDDRSNKEVRTDVVNRIARDRDVRPPVVLDEIVAHLQPDIGSVAALERAIDGWLNGKTDLRRALQKHAVDQIDDRSIAEFFKNPIARSSPQATADSATQPSAPTERAPALDATDLIIVDDDVHGEANADDQAMEDATARAAAEEVRAAAEAEEARARAEAAVRAADEARARAEAAAKARAEAERKAKAEAERKAKAEAERKARAEAERKAKAEAEAKAAAEAEERARAEAEEKARVAAEEHARREAEAKAQAEAAEAAAERAGADESALARRTVVLDEDVASYFADGRAVNDFLRATLAAMRVVKRRDDGD